jgi:hypothetical protein
VRPSDRTLRDELRREAAKAQIPGDMWKNISKQLDQDAARRERRWQWLLRGAQWRPAMVLAVAAGFFWFALIPALPNMENMPGTTRSQSSEVAPSRRSDTGPFGPKGTRPYEDTPEPQTVVQTTSAAPVKPYLHFPTVPQ